MKQLLLAAFLCVTAAAHAQKHTQKVVAPLPAAPIIHCMLIATGRVFENEVLTLDYGQNSALQAQDSVLATAAKQVHRLDSVPAALNYLYSLGWECVQTTTLTRDGSSSLESEIGYLLRRRAQ
jgi:hypothetical protein